MYLLSQNGTLSQATSLLTSTHCADGLPTNRYLRKEKIESLKK